MWYFAATKVLGSSHLECQDYFECLCKGDVFIGVLADGAGSVKYGGEGAEVASKRAMDYMRDALITSQRVDFESVVRETVLEARESLVTLAEERNEVLREFSTTLLVIFVTSRGGAAAQIGDGVMVVCEASDNGDGWREVFWPQHGEYINTTSFLSQLSRENLSLLLQMKTLDASITDIMLLSDGLETFILNYQEKRVHVPAVKGLFNPIRHVDQEGEGEVVHLSEALNGFLRNSERIRQGTTDDLSLILATFREEEEGVELKAEEVTRVQEMEAVQGLGQEQEQEAEILVTFKEKGEGVEEYEGWYAKVLLYLKHRRDMLMEWIVRRRRDMDDYIVRVRVGRGDMKYVRGYYGEAVRDYSRAIRVRSDYGVAYNNRGCAYHVQGYYEEAMRDYDRALVLNSDYALAYFNRGLVKYKLEDYRGAIEDYDEAIRVDPIFTKAYNSRGVAKYTLGKAEAAIEDYERAIRIDPDYVKAYHNRELARVG